MYFLLSFLVAPHVVTGDTQEYAKKEIKINIKPLLTSTN